MPKLIKMKVLGTALIPKFNMHAPMIICETEDFFTQLKNQGFRLEPVLEEPKEETSTLTVEPVLEEFDPISALETPSIDKKEIEKAEKSLNLKKNKKKK